MTEQATPIYIYGLAASAEGYEIRDYLTRNVVPFKWVELVNDSDCSRELGFPSLADVRLPVVRMPDGLQLFAPSLRELAERLGWITHPQLNQDGAD